MSKRVVSKSLFNFTPKGVLDQDIRAYEENKPQPDGKTLTAMKMLTDKNDSIFVYGKLAMYQKIEEVSFFMVFLLCVEQCENLLCLGWLAATCGSKKLIIKLIYMPTKQLPSKTL